MPGKIYLYFLILCGIWSQCICGTYADGNIRNSSISLVRQKRVISYVPGEDRIVAIRDHPYIVHIKYLNRIHCVGTILSDQVVLTTAECVRYGVLAQYRIVSNSAVSNYGTPYNVIEIKLHSHQYAGRTSDGIALLTVHPTIYFNEFADKVDLHVGPILSGMHGIVSGWGFNYRQANGRGTAFPLHLRSIEVPILSHRECVDKYQPYIRITDKLICTFHSLKRTGHNDAGAPLIIDNFLVGIFLFRGPNRSSDNDDYPDVFALLQHTDYRTWIRANI